LNHQEIVEKNIDTYNETATIEYSKYFEGTPTFVTYYSRDLLNSTDMETLEDVNEVIGDESPYQYHKIENFTVYGLEGFSPNLTKEDYGYNTEVESEITILPNTIRPLPDDYFSIKYSEEVCLFKVTEVNSDRLDGKTFYKVNYKLSSSKVDDIEEQTNEDSYVQIYDNLGTKENSIIHSKAFEIIQYIDGIIYELIKDYNGKYYNKQLDIHEYRFNDKKLYNQSGAYFCEKNNVFKLSSYTSFLDTVHIRDILRRDLSADLFYQNTLYLALEKKNISEKLSADGMKLSLIQEKYSAFHFTYESYSNITFVDIPKENGEQTNNNVYHVFDSEFKNNIMTNTLYEDEEILLLENVIIAYLNDGIKSFDDICKVLDKLNDNDYIYDIRNYLLVPMIIFILKQLKDDVDKRKSINK